MFFFFILKSFTKELATKESIAQEKTIAAKLQKNEAQVEQLYKEWNNKWKETHKIMEVGLIMFLFFIFTIVQYCLFLVLLLNFQLFLYLAIDFKKSVFSLIKMSANSNKLTMLHIIRPILFVFL